MIYTKPYLQTIREEYRDAFRYMSNVKTKIENECKTVFEKIDNGTGYISIEDFLQHFVEDKDTFEKIKEKINSSGFLSLDDVINILLI
tara:strand:+ start:3649 stop:3912 length:264 start_codon:yes stop_codon:yes gene_type:complete